MTQVVLPNRTFNQFVLNGAAGTVDWLPEVDARWADEIVYQVMVEQITGAPTSWSLKPYFQQLIGESQGQQEWALQFGQTPTVATLDAVDNAALLPDGDWPMFTEGLAIPLLTPVLRRIRGGFEHRLCFDWALAAGTAPTILLTVAGPIIRG